MRMEAEYRPKKSEKIEAFCSTEKGSRLVIGLSSGYLRVLKVTPDGMFDKGGENIGIRVEKMKIFENIFSYFSYPIIIAGGL